VSTVQEGGREEVAVQTEGSKRWGGNISVALAKSETQDVKREVADFLEKNPAPDDDAWHAWAKERGIDVHLAEAEAYALAGRLVKFLRGGRSRGEATGGVPDEEVAMGVKVESEHVDDPEIQRKIAYDHVAEHRGYYPALKRMEKEMGG